MTVVTQPPGKILAQEMMARGLTVEALAKKIGLSPETIQRVIDGRTGISAGLAILLEEALGKSMCFWLDQQHSYDRLRLGWRDNQGKLRYDLISPAALRCLAEVYTRGAAKYGERNWERGLRLMDCFASLMRHAWAWAAGEDLDAESGLHHMAHAMWNAAAIVHFWQEGRRELDNRVSRANPE